MRKIVPPVIVFLILLVVMPRSARLNYDYRKGSPWKYETLVAPFSFPVLKTEDQMLEERRQASAWLVPYYRSRDDVASESLRTLGDTDLGVFEFMRSGISATLARIYEKGIKGDDAVESPSDVVYIQRNKRASACRRISASVAGNRMPYCSPASVTAESSAARNI